MVRVLCQAGVGEHGKCMKVSTGTWESLTPPYDRRRESQAAQNTDQAYSVCIAT